MQQPFTATGGARVGWMNASWPLARLSARSEKLTVTVRILGTYTFTPDQIVAIERYVLIPFFGWGVRISHCKADCPQRIIFWSLGNPDRILNGIRNAGFVPTGSLATMPTVKGMALRWSFIIVAVLVWNILFMIGASLAKRAPSHAGFYVCGTILLVFAFSVGLLFSRKLQSLALKPGRSGDELRPFLRLFTSITGFLFVIFSILWITGAWKEPR